MGSNSIQKYPDYWELLSEQDKNEYQALKVTFNTGSIKRNRGHRIETFDGILGAIHQYAEKGQDTDWRRFLVCGVCWIENAIAINTRQLRILISKCKSSINGSLQKLGYYTNTSHSESWKILFSRIPLLKDNYPEIRQWTIRQRIPQFSIAPQFPFNATVYSFPEIQQVQYIPVLPSPSVSNQEESNQNLESNSIQPPQNDPSVFSTAIVPVKSTIEIECETTPENNIISIPISRIPLKFRAKFQTLTDQS